jgi:CheY-like chemotaxis protein
MMPRMNGWEVLQHLQERPQPTRPLVIVLTAGNEPRNLPTELVAGTIRKPFDVDLLIETVVACIAALPELTQQDSCSTPESDKSCPSADPEVLN